MTSRARWTLHSDRGSWFKAGSLWAMLLIFSACRLACASGAIVNAKAFSTNGASSLSVTISSTTSGNTLLCIVEAIQSGVTSVSCSATGDTFTNRGNLSLNKLMAWNQADSITGGITSVTVTPSAFAQMQGYVLEISGTSGFDLLNSGHANSFGQSNPQACGSITTSNSSDFLVAFWTDIQDQNGTFSSFTSGWTGGTSADSSDYATISESSTGTFSPQASYSATTNAKIDCAVIAIKQSGSASVCSPTLAILGAGRC